MKMKMKKFWSSKKLFDKMAAETFREMAASAREAFGSELQCCFAMRLYYGGASVFDGVAEDDRFDGAAQELSVMLAQVGIQRLTYADDGDDLFEMCVGTWENAVDVYVQSLDIFFDKKERCRVILATAVLDNEDEDGLQDPREVLFRAALDRAEDILRRAYEGKDGDTTEGGRSSVGAVLKEMSGVINLLASDDLGRTDHAVVRKALKSFRKSLLR